MSCGENDIDFTLWCYYADNTDKDGDDWNGENLSIRMRDGSRCIMSVVRPFAFLYPSNAEVTSQHFDPFSQTYKLEMVLKEVKVDEMGLASVIDVFIPSCHFPGMPATSFSVSSGSVVYRERSQILVWTLDEDTLITQISLVVEKK